MEYEIIKLNLARNCLRYIIKTFEIKELYIPHYLCPAIRLAVKKENCNISFYHIDENFYPITEFPQNAFILYPNYWGVCSYNVEKLTNKYPNIIVDNAHSFYSMPMGIACFNSLRKFFSNLKDGAFLYISKTKNIDLIQDTYFYNYQKPNYKDICENESRLDKADIKLISNITMKYFSQIDIDNEKKKYTENFLYWQNRLSNRNNLKLSLSDNDIPLFYPYLTSSVEEADKMVKKLDNEGITVYKYWNNLPDNFSEKMFYERLVAIPL